MKKLTITLLSILSTSCLFAQQEYLEEKLELKQVKKSIHIERTKNSPQIDGVLDDDIWKNAKIATDFVMFRPDNGKKAPENIRTEVKIAYDDEAIYFGAYLYDDKPNEIPMEFQTRDNFGNADFFGVVLNPANDGVNQTEFFVTSAGNQNDAKVTAGGNEDFSWNAVWTSSVKLMDDGWIVEIKIPYSALRFSNDEVQTWGLNFHRHHKKNRDQYTWNFIDREKGTIALYDGTITGIKNIKPPVRLSFNPFIFGGVTSFDGTDEYNWSAGLDVKYGISENLTLDATLIPDFGQVGFDDVTLNLGPFEQRFSEQRAFFTEGTDLFRKGNLFESRRIGNAPSGDITLEANESIAEYPNKVDVINIVKISGRTKKGLGIGVLNALTKKTEVKINKTETVSGNTVTTNRNEVIEPLTNYNVFVLDKQFNKNSSVSLVNTNVIRNGSNFRDANVTAFLYDIKTKNNKYGINGGIAMSNVFNVDTDNPVTGLEGDIEIGKISGNHQYDVGVNFINKKYNKNDLGFQWGNNELDFSGSYSYRIFKPKGKFNNINLSAWGNMNYLMELDDTTLSYQEKSNLYRGNRFGLNAWLFTTKQLSFGGNFNTSIGEQYNYYEPRNQSEGRFFKAKPSTGMSIWISTNYSKKFAIDASIFQGIQFNDDTKDASFRFSPRYRFSDKITLIYTLNYAISSNLKGYVNEDSGGNIIFGNRDSKRITNSIATKYNFSTKAALSLSFRHFWSPVEYDNQYYKLEHNGVLSPDSYTDNHDINFNTWNIDLNFNWEFAPGSQLIALYRNSIFNQDDQSQLEFGNNLNNLFDQPVRHDISLKLVYYLDYNNIGGLFKKSNS